MSESEIINPVKATSDYDSDCDYQLCLSSLLKYFFLLF